MGGLSGPGVESSTILILILAIILLRVVIVTLILILVLILILALILALILIINIGSNTNTNSFSMPASSQQVDDESENATAGEAESDVKWTSNSRATRIRVGMPLGDKPWTRSHSLMNLNNANIRAKEVIDIAFWSYLLKTPMASERSSAPAWFVDASQSVLRTTGGPHLPCLG
jgi:hypothetical protein